MMQKLKNENMNKSSFSASSSSSSSLSSSNFSLPQADNTNTNILMASSTNTSGIGGHASTNHHNSFLTDKFVKKTNRVKDTTNTLTSIDNFIEEKTSLGWFLKTFLIKLNLNADISCR